MRSLSTIELIFLVVLIVPPILLGVVVAIDRWRRGRSVSPGAGQTGDGATEGEEKAS